MAAPLTTASDASTTARGASVAPSPDPTRIPAECVPAGRIVAAQCDEDYFVDGEANLLIPPVHG
jgi:hypothetical protein